MMVHIERYREQIEQPWGKLYYDILFKQLEGIEGKRILDFGSGFGIVANFLADRNNVIAIEPNQEMIALRKQESSYQQLHGSMEVLEGFPDASFDMIICHNVLEYVDNRVAYFQEFSRLLTSMGRLSIVKHHEVGRIMQTVVFENDVAKALGILAGEKYETHSMGQAMSYVLENDLSKTKLHIQDYQGIRIFYGLQENAMKFAPDWRQKLLEMEVAVYETSPYRDIAAFQHVWIEKKD